MRALSLLALTTLVSTPLVSQGNPADPDKKVTGGGTVPAGWSYRLDDSTATLAKVKFVPMGGGLHFTTGTWGIYWRDADAVTGSFHTIATFVETKTQNPHAEGYGLFLMGNDLKGANQSYIYFLVRPDGMFTIRQRIGGNVTNVTTQGNRTGWVANPALVKMDSATGKARNLLEISSDAVAKKVTFKVNGKTVHEMNATGGTVGVIGIRMNHNLDVHVDGFAVHKM